MKVGSLLKIIACPNILGLIALACLVGTAGICSAQANIKITKPADYAEVDRSTVVEGFAEIKPGQHLWVLVSPGNYGELWWPNGEARIDPNSQSWSVPVYLGGPDDRGEFRIAVVVVDSREHLKLENYTRKTSGKADYGPQPIMMPRLSAEPHFRSVIRK